MSEQYTIHECRACGSTNLAPIISLGNQYITNFVNSEEDHKKIPKVPLDLIICKDCKVLQLRHNAPAESMWDEQYWYKSGISTTIKNDLKDIVEKSTKLVDIKDDDVVIDIGANDGTLLSFHTKGNYVGFEPSKNVANEAKSKGFKIINDFFNAELFKKEFGDKKAKLITAISMFYDLEDPNQFLRDIISVLDKEGLFVIQQNYLATMLKYNAFDNICHEHREYYSFLALRNLLEKHGLEIFDVEQSTINGGSIRTYIRLKGSTSIKPFDGADQRIAEIIDMENKMELNTMKPYLEFAARIDKIKEDLVNFLKQEKAKGKRIWIYGASTRGNVILQYFDLTTKLIDAIADKNADKYGKKTVGSLIPIFPPEDMRNAHPDYLVVNTWHFFDEIKTQENEYFQKGGTLIAPLPELRVVRKN